MLPDSIIRVYLEPLLALDGIFDLSKDREEDWPMTEVFPVNLIESMDSAGVDRTVILPLDFGMVEEPEVGVEAYNRWAFESCEPYGDRLIPFIGVDPNRGAAATALIESCVKKYDARGIKIYPATGFRPNEERLADFWDMLDEYNLVVVTHSGASWGPLDEECNHPIFYREVASRHPALKVVIAHLGGKWRSETYELAGEFDNVFADCSAIQGWLPSEPDVAKARLAEATSRMPGRVVFGSDWPLFDLSYPYSNWVRFVSEEDWGSEEAKERLLGGTMMRILSG